MRGYGRRNIYASLLVAVTATATPGAASAFCAGDQALLRIEAEARAAVGAPSAVERRRSFDMLSFLVSDYDRALSKAAGASVAALTDDYMTTRRDAVALYRDRRTAAALARLSAPEADPLERIIRNFQVTGRCADESDAQRSVAALADGLPGDTDDGVAEGDGSGGTALARASDAELAPLSDSAPKRLAFFAGVGAYGGPEFILGAAAFLILMAVFAMGSDVLQRRRRLFPRVMCNMPVSVDIGGLTCGARMIDVSRGGAKIAVAHRARCGEIVDVVIGEASERSKVVWANDRYIGLRFQEALSPAKLSRVVEIAKTESRTARLAALQGKGPSPSPEKGRYVQGKAGVVTRPLSPA